MSCKAIRASILMFCAAFIAQPCAAQKNEYIHVSEDYPLGEDVVLGCILENPNNHTTYKMIELFINHDSAQQKIGYVHSISSSPYEKNIFSSDFQLWHDIKNSAKVYSGSIDSGKLFYISLRNDGYEYVFYKIPFTPILESKYGIVTIKGGSIISRHRCLHSKDDAVNDEYFSNVVTSAAHKPLPKFAVETILRDP